MNNNFKDMMGAKLVDFTDHKLKDESIELVFESKGRRFKMQIGARSNLNHNYLHYDLESWYIAYEKKDMDDTDSVNGMATQDLLKQANDGRRAVLELYAKHGDNLEYFNPKNARWSRYSQPPFKGLKYRVVKPKFEEYVIKSSGWVVKLHEYPAMEGSSVLAKEIQIGCERFGYYGILKVLQALVNRAEPRYVLRPAIVTHSSQEMVFDATRNGIRYGHHTMRWEAAAQLLKKMEVYDKGEG